ncbi:hypothetical protein MHU86_4247 [Fragilaria crotonensis]|nr:hypothetical protein MHU86_4247 [Fragilaria crotonensis]
MAQPDPGGDPLAAGVQHPAAEAHPGIPVAPVLPSTYRELYTDAANNPSRDRTAGFMAGYRFMDPTGGAIPTPAALRDQTVALSDRQPIPLLALVTGVGGTHEVVVVHRLVRYVDAPGDDPTGLHDSVLGLMGDILPHQYPTVEVLGTAFHLIGNAVRVPTTAAMATIVPTWDDATTPVLGPYTDQVPETEVVRPRHTQVIPGRYAALLIHRRRVRPKTAYQEIVGALQANNDMEACSDVVTWLRAACTARGGGGANNMEPGVLHAFAALHLPAEVYGYITAKVRADLPGVVGAMRPGGDLGAATLAGALRLLGAARGTVDDREGTAGGAPKTIVDAYKETYPTLLKYCNSATTDGVAPVWMRLANCHKSEQHTVLTQELHKVCLSRHLTSELYAPIITTTLKQMVVGLQFVGHGADDLASGCQPFLVSYAGTDHHYTAVAAASVGNQLSQGEQNASLADYRSIREREKVKFPRDISDACITLTRYAVLCQCLFQGTTGAEHPFVETMWAAAAALQNIAPYATEQFHRCARLYPGIGGIYHAKILRAIQLGVHDYLTQVATNQAAGVTGVVLPSFSSLMKDLKQGTFPQSTNWIAIPEAYLDPIPAPAAASAGAPSVSGTTISQGTNRTGVSSLTATTDATERVSRVANPAPDAEIGAITLRPGGARRIMEEHPPPTNDAGTSQLCVAWWTRGGCFPNCRRKATHQPFASEGERTRLISYICEHLQATA